MKRWLLPIGELVIGLAMVPEAFLFGALGTLPMIETILVRKHLFQSGGLAHQENLYTWALLVASFSVDAATILCLLSAVLLMRKPSQRGVRLSIAGAVCYWLFIGGHFAMISAESRGPRGGLTLWDGADYLIGIIAALVAFALYWHGRMNVTPTAGSQVQPGTS